MNDDLPSSSLTLKDIARRLGISSSTASRALRDSPRVSKETRQQVQALAAQVGYHPNPMGAGLANFKRASTVKPIQASLAWINFWADPKAMRGFKEFDRYWNGAQSTAEKFGYRLEEFDWTDIRSSSRLEEILLSRGINGLMIAPSDLPPEWATFHWDRFSTVRFGRRDTAPLVHIVTSDQASNAMLAFRTMRSKGYKRIGYVGVPWLQRMYAAGFLWAQTAVPEQDRIAPLMYWHDAPDSSAVLREWMVREKPDAILTEVPILKDVLPEIGVRVPEDIGVAAMNILDVPFDAGIDSNAEEIGRVAALVVISLIQDNSTGIPKIQREILVKGTWVDGASLPDRT